MCKKIFSCICIGIIFISILNPLKVKAYSTDLNNYVDSNLTPEQMEDAIGSSIIGYLLGAGAEFIIPGSGQTVQGLYDQINDIIDESVDIKNNIVSWIQDKQIRFENPHLWLPMYWGDTYSYEYNKGPVADAANYYIQRMLEINNGDNQQDVPTNYLPYIELINGASFNYAYYLTDNWATTLTTSTNHISGYYLISDPKNYSFYNKNWSNTALWNSSSHTGYYVARMNNNQYQLLESYTLEPVSLYINLVDNTYQVTTSTFIYKPLLHGNSYGDSYTCGFMYDTNQSKITSFTGRTLSQPNVYYTYSSNSLEDCFKNIAMRWRNVNIYVNGIPWSIVTQPPDPVQVGGNTYLTGTNLPVEFKFPEGTQNDLALIKSILHQLIDLNNTGNAITIQIDDILEAFTDEYGQQAMYVIVVHRNDYDKLIYEQYPYNVIVNKVHGLYFPENQINSYVDEMTYITKTAGSDLIPNDILVILGAGGVLLLIAFLINRLLE